jgi:hypothetical protein
MPTSSRIAVMRIALAVCLILILSALAAADEPAPLLKPVVPRGIGVRVRIPTSEAKSGFYHLAAQAVKAKGGMADITAAFEVRSGQSYVSAKKWRSWGYEVSANKVGVLPELMIRGVQVAPKLSQGRDVEFRLTDLHLQIVEPPKGADTVIGCDLLLALNDVSKNADRAYEPRLYFADNFLELTVPASSVKRPGTGDMPLPEPAVNPDLALVPFLAPVKTRGVAVFTSSAINGLARYRISDGKEKSVSVTMSSTTNCPGGIMVSMGTARGCKIELEEKEIRGTGTSFETAIAKGKVKELRLGVRTGPGYQTARDLVFKDVTVWVDKNDSGHMVWLGPSFLRDQLANPVYACGPDGAWKLFGRAKPEMLVKPLAKKP